MLHLTGEAVKLAAIAVNGDKGRDAIAHMFPQGIVEQGLRFFNVSCLHGIGILPVTVFQPLLRLCYRVDMPGEIVQDLVIDILRTAVADIQGVPCVFPEILDGLADVLEDVPPSAAVVGIAP